jgi:hypothetical protein
MVNLKLALVGLVKAACGQQQLSLTRIIDLSDPLMAQSVLSNGVSISPITPATFILSENPSTGYIWLSQITPAGCLSLVEAAFAPLNSIANPGGYGVGQTRSFFVETKLLTP